MKYNNWQHCPFTGGLKWAPRVQGDIKFGESASWCFWSQKLQATDGVAVKWPGQMLSAPSVDESISNIKEEASSLSH